MIYTFSTPNMYTFLTFMKIRQSHLFEKSVERPGCRNRVVSTDENAFLTCTRRCHGNTNAIPARWSVLPERQTVHGIYVIYCIHFYRQSRSTLAESKGGRLAFSCLFLAALSAVLPPQQQASTNMQIQPAKRRHREKINY